MKKIIFLFILAFCFQTVDAQTFTEKIKINCADTTYVSGLGYPTWNDPKIIKKPRVGTAILLGDFAPPNILEYTAPDHFSGSDTVVIQCAHATQIVCDTGIYIFEISCDSILKNGEPKPKMLTIFPNPANNFVQFDFDFEILELKLTNVFGQIFPQNWQIENGRAILEISTFPQGEYFILGKMKTGNFFGQFFKT